jgi:hypothetical protein
VGKKMGQEYSGLVGRKYGGKQWLEEDGEGKRNGGKKVERGKENVCQGKGMVIIPIRELIRKKKEQKVAN